MDYETLKKRMVEGQLIARGIKDLRVRDAFYKVPRHEFVPAELKAYAYDDCPLPIGEGQTISQPYIVALMTEHLDLKGQERVLEIGTGSGYQTAILAELAQEVYTIERQENLAKKAGLLLEQLGYNNIRIKVADGSLGWQEAAPFDRIIVTAASPQIPPPLTEQLKDPGKLIIPLGANFNQMLTAVEKKNKELQISQICGCLFVPLVGKYGFTL